MNWPGEWAWNWMDNWAGHWAIQGLIVVVILAACTTGWALNNRIRDGEVNSPDNEPAALPALSEGEDIERLRAENRRLQLRLDASERRLAVLEGIVTDRGFAMAAHMEAWRDHNADPLTPSAATHMEVRA